MKETLLFRVPEVSIQGWFPGVLKLCGDSTVRRTCWDTAASLSAAGKQIAREQSPFSPTPTSHRQVPVLGNGHLSKYGFNLTGYVSQW